MAVNKVVVNDQTIMDLTGDTVNTTNLLKGYTAHNKAGKPVTGAVEVSTIYSGTEDPSSSLGSDGDVYIQIGE